MARFKIISKDGGTIRYEGKPKYVGTYLRPSYLEFSEIASPVPISWEVGDYVEYSRTGMTYRLYSIPQPTKNARKGSHGRAFTYSGVQLFAATKELEIALFRDLVSNDNNIHFSTSPDVVTFEDVYGIARRIQECMDDFYPGRWEIRVADFDESEDAEIISKISEAKDFALSGGTCLDALSKIYELWQDVGWIHTHENGKEVITIGYTSKRIDANTSESYLYGKGNGLTAIKKAQINRDEFATRLYVYGSERNLPSRYYNTKGILNADSVDIRNLMLPLDKWGTTDNLPDARKAYLENAEAVARFGVIPKTHYFDSDDAGANIYPSISGMTIGMLRKVLDDMGQTKYYPSESNYPDPSQRIDEVRFCYNPEDDGAINIEPIRHSEHEFAEMSGGAVSSTQFIVENKFLFSEEFTLEEGKACEMVVSPHISGYVEDRGYSSVVVSLRLQDSRFTSSIGNSAVQKAYAKKDGDRWTFDLPEVRFNYAKSPITGFGCNVYITIEGNGASNENSAYVLNAGTVDFSLYPIQSETFVIRLHELGFNIDEMAKIGNGKTISMKTGACAGRSFKIEKSRHKSFYWDITCRRQKDSTLGQIFPNSSYQIQAGDRFVLVDIGMPESYIRVAMERLLSEGEKLLSRASKIQNHYEPSIDAKVMMESGRTLREGMFMEITDEDVVDNTTDYILIDSLSIIEDESSIPTYKVTLKERRKVTYKGTPSATSTTDTETSVGGSENEEGFATETFVTEQINILKGLWHIDESTGYLVTDYQVHIKKSLLIDGDVASGGEGENTPAEGTVTRIEVDGTSYDPDTLGVIDLSEAFKNVKVDLSDYYTKYEVNELIDQIKAGDIDLANYYTKEEIDGKGFLTSASLVGYAKTSDVDAVVDRVKLLEDAGYATTGYVSEAISDLNIGQFATKTALAATVEALSAEIGKKADADNVADTYATKTALSTVDNRLVSIESYFATSEDAGNQIDKWNEIVAFLNATEGTTLAGILAAYTLQTDFDVLSSDVANISNTVKSHTSSIGSNAIAIGVLQGYFTNGVAKKATADASGNVITSYYTPISTHNALAERVDTAEGNITSLTNGKADKATTLAGYGITNAYTKGETDSLLGKYVLLEKASQTIKGDITIEGNLVITGDVASGGEGGNTSAEGTVTGVTVSGVDYTSVEAGLLDLTDLMANYALKSDSTKVSVSPSLSSGKSIGVISVDGVGTTLYAPATYAWSEISEKPNALLFGGTSSQFLKADGSVDSTSYLPLTGGTIASGSNDVPLTLKSSGTTTWLKFNTEDGKLRFLGVGNDNTLKFQYDAITYTVLHSGNYSDYALPLTGGRITGNSLDIGRENNVNGAFTRLYINASTAAEYGTNLRHYYSSSAYRGLRLASDDIYYDNNGTINPLLHSGNVGSQNAGSANMLKFIGEVGSSGFNANTDLAGGGFIHNYDAISWWGSSVPSTLSYGVVYQLQGDPFGANLAGQLAWDINHHGADSTRSLWWRANDNTAFANAKWHQIAFTDSTVASAYKLVTSAGADAVTIGTNGIELHSGFVGYKDGDAYRYLGPQGSQKKLRFYNSTEWKDIAFTDSDITGTASNARNLVTSDNMLVIHIDDSLRIGDSIFPTTNTHIFGRNILMRVGESASVSVFLNSSGNVTIGDSDLASTTTKLYVDGGIRFTPRTIWGQSFDGTGDVWGNLNLHSDKLIFNSDASNYFISCQGTSLATYNMYGGHSFCTAGGTQRMTITSGGNVLIGKTDNSGDRLQVAGTACIEVGNRIHLFSESTFASYDKTLGGFFLYGGIREGEAFSCEVAGANGSWKSSGFKLMQNGNVLIGATTDNGAKLQVNGTFRCNALRTNSAAVTYWGISDEGILSWDTTYASVMAKSGLALRLGIDGTPYITIASNGAISMAGTLTANSGATITGDVTINGNLIVSGDVASGGTGQDTPSDGNTSTSTSGVLTLTGEIPQGSNIPQSSLDAIGLTDQVIADLLIGKYHHVMYTSGVTTYCFVVSGQYNSDYKAFTLHWGDDYMDEFMGYVFALGSSGGWNITIYEI